MVGNSGKNTEENTEKSANDSVSRLLKKLDGSIGLLEETIDGHVEVSLAAKDTEAEVQRMGADRVRLAGSLDDAEARCQRLEKVNSEVSLRLVNAMETIRSVLEKNR